MGQSKREYIYYHTKILFRTWSFCFPATGKKKRVRDQFYHMPLMKKTNSRIHISQSSGWHFKLFCLSESLLVFVPYGQTLCTAFIFPGRGEKHNVPALFLLSICTDEQNNSDKKSEKRVKLNERKKLNSF